LASAASYLFVVDKPITGPDLDALAMRSSAPLQEAA
jgi:hypothetical protein